MVMGAVQDRFGLTLAEVREEAGIPAGVDPVRVQRWLDEALSAADNYLNNPFLLRMRDGSLVSPIVQLPIPPEVEQGVIEYVAARWRRSPSNPSFAGAGVTSERVGDLSKTYDAAVASNASLPLDSAIAYWRLYRLEPGF